MKTVQTIIKAEK